MFRSRVLLLRSVYTIRPRYVRAYSIAEKYQEKLAKRAKAQGISVSDLLVQAQQSGQKDVYDPLDLISKTNKKSEQKKEAPSVEDSETPEDRARRITEQSIRDSTSGTSDGKTKTLATFVDVEKLRLHDKKEIEMIWKARFLNKSTEFSGVLTPEPFSRLYTTARKYPTFVLPLPRDEGIELHYVQWSFVESQTMHCLLTSLAEYKLHGEYARPHTTFMLHTDLVADKEIILSNTSLQDNQISLDNAVLLALNLQRFYTADPASPHGKKKFELIQKFNTGDTSFSTDELIEATEVLD